MKNKKAGIDRTSLVKIIFLILFFAMVIGAVLLILKNWGV